MTASNMSFSMIQRRMLLSPLPATPAAGSQDSLKKNLTHESVITDRQGGIPRRKCGGYSVLNPLRTLGLESKSDFPHVMQGRECGSSLRQQGTDTGSQSGNQLLCHTTDIDTVVKDGDARKAVVGGFRPEFRFELIHPLSGSNSMA